MDEIIQYEIQYSPSALQDIREKSDYIAYTLKSPETALTWYQNLRHTIQMDLATFPYRYPIYRREPWESKEIRIMLSKNDIVLYQINAAEKIITIHMVCTKGKNLADIRLEQ